MCLYFIFLQESTNVENDRHPDEALREMFAAVFAELLSAVCFYINFFYRKQTETLT